MVRDGGAVHDDCSQIHLAISVLFFIKIKKKRICVYKKQRTLQGWRARLRVIWVKLVKVAHISSSAIIFIYFILTLSYDFDYSTVQSATVLLVVLYIAARRHSIALVN